MMGIKVKEDELVTDSLFYKEHALKKQRILEYKWLESEKRGHDIGLDRAWIEWEAKYYRIWKDSLNTETEEADI